MTVCKHCYIDSATVAFQAERINVLEQETADMRARLKDQNGEGLLPYGTQGLTPQQVRMLSLLLTRERVSEIELYNAAGSDAEDPAKLVHVQMHKIRKKVAPLGLDIETIWGFGYRIERENRDDVLKKLEVA